MKKSTICFLLTLALPFCASAQFDNFRLPYQNPNHIGLLLDSAVLPAGNFKTMIYQYEASTGIWRLSDQIITEREGSRITKTIHTRYPVNNNPSVLVTTFDYAGEKLLTITSYSKSSNTNDTVLNSRDTFYYNNDAIVMRHGTLTLPPRIATEYIYDTMDRFAGSRLVVYDTTLSDITFVGYFEVDDFFQNQPVRLSKYSYIIPDTFFVHKDYNGYEIYRYDSLNRLTSKLSYFFNPFFGDNLLIDTIRVIYNSNNNPAQMLRWINVTNVKNRITSYSYNNDQILTEVLEQEENGNPLSRITYTTDLTLGTSDLVAQRISLKLYPNPAKSTVAILADSDIQIESITLYTINGKRIMEITKPASEIAIKHLAPGLYFAEITSNRGNVNKRLVVQ
jgi:hypothetical protein